MNHKQEELLQFAKVARKPTKSVNAIRQEFAEYLSANDKVPW